MVLEGLTWIPHTWDQLVGLCTSCKKGSARCLSDDITIEILSRLPADCVLECRRVCRKWRALTSSPSFAELHLKRATTTPPSLFLHWLDYSLGSSISPSKKHGELNFFVYDKIGQKANSEKRIITKVLCSSGKEMYHYGAKVVNSCDGLIMFLATCRSAAAFVFNPVTQELITIPCPFALTNPCGIYFHPSTHEYKLLSCAYKELSLPQDYYTYSLKSKVWKNLNYSSYCRTTRGHRPAILLNRCLHWIVHRNDTINNNNNNIFNHPCKYAIMVFGTETEDFQVLPHPGDACYYRPNEHENMHLLGTRDHMYLCHVTWNEVIHVWVLEDYACWVWNRRYKVNLDWDVKCFPFDDNPPNSPSYDTNYLKVLGAHNGELLIYWKARGLFSYHLEQNTVGKVAIKVEGCVTPSPWASVYTKSLISLSDIYAGKYN
ncbi:hypothetical protein LguiB_006346 [Lonicera macranthoides]